MIDYLADLVRYFSVNALLHIEEILDKKIFEDLLAYTIEYTHEKHKSNTSKMSYSDQDDILKCVIERLLTEYGEQRILRVFEKYLIAKQINNTSYGASYLSPAMEPPSQPVALDLTGVPKDQQGFLIAKLKTDVERAKNEATAPKPEGLRAHALPPGLPVSVPPSKRHVADMTPAEREKKNVAARRYAATYRAKKRSEQKLGT